jgi:cobalt/nickel transport system permease protein
VAALVGLPSAIVVMSSVLIVQCLVFGDGGLLALGANICNMALVSCIVGYSVYRLIGGRAPRARRRVAALAFAAWCSTVVGAASCAEELALSGAAPLHLVLTTMLGVHALIGLGEAAITALVLASVLRFHPEFLRGFEADAGSGWNARAKVSAGFGFSIVVVLLLSPMASASPDGLSRVAERLGLHARRSGAASPLDGYRIRGLDLGSINSAIAGACGTLLIFGLCWLLAVVLVPRASNAAP